VLCILYVVAVGTCLSLAGLLLERMLPPAWPRRWLWCAVMAGSVLTPALYRAHHAARISAMIGERPAPGAHASHDVAWWSAAGAYDDTLGGLWSGASLLLLLWGAAGAWRISLLVAGAARRPAVVLDGVRVLVTDRLGPATAGVMRSRVLVPRWVLALPAAQRRYVVRHEEEHRRAGDPRLLLLASLPVVLLPWNLPLWWQLSRLRLAVELDCDRRVISALGDPEAYGNLLLTVASAPPGPRVQPAFLGGAGSLERRLRGLLTRRPVGRLECALAVTAAALLLLLVLATPHPIAG
jgi:hypothetical protein